MRDHELTDQSDVLVLGAGWGGLTAASLLAKAGRKVVLLEAQDRAGGCGHSFERSGFSFCAEMQYLMGCGPGGIVQQWLQTLDVEKEVEFNAFDADGYDRIELPGLSFRIPHDAHRLQANLRAVFPAEQQNIDDLFAVLLRMEAEIAGGVFEAKRFLRHPFQYKDTVLYGPWPVERVFNHFNLSPQLRAVLAGQCGDIGLPPREEPFLCLQAVLFGYCESAHFPKRGMRHFVDRVLDFIRRHGGEIHFSTPVTALIRDGDRIAHATTPRGPFSAHTVVSNIDPATTMAMIEDATLPSYESSASCFTVFLGLDIDLAKHGFGRSNIWHYPDDDLDAVLARTMKEHNYQDPFFFLSTPSLYADPGILAPQGCTTVQLNVGSDFDYFAAAQRAGNHATEKARITAEILAAVERRLIPGLTRHCVVQESWSPVDLALKVGLPRGGMYGARLDFENRVLRRVSQRTAFENLFLTGATAGSPGLQGVVAASTRLVDSLLAEG